MSRRKRILKPRTSLLNDELNAVQKIVLGLNGMERWLCFSVTDGKKLDSKIIDNIIICLDINGNVVCIYTYHGVIDDSDSSFAAEYGYDFLRSDGYIGYSFSSLPRERNEKNEEYRRLYSSYILRETSTKALFALNNISYESLGLNEVFPKELVYLMKSFVVNL